MKNQTIAIINNDDFNKTNLILNLILNTIAIYKNVKIYVLRRNMERIYNTYDTLKLILKDKIEIYDNIKEFPHAFNAMRKGYSNDKKLVIFENIKKDDFEIEKIMDYIRHTDCNKVNVILTMPFHYKQIPKEIRLKLTDVLTHQNLLLKDLGGIINEHKIPARISSFYNMHKSNSDYMKINLKAETADQVFSIHLKEFIV